MCLDVQVLRCGKRGSTHPEKLHSAFVSVPLSTDGYPLFRVEPDVCSTSLSISRIDIAGL